MPFYVTDQAETTKIHYSIWTAASNGDLEQVRAHVESRGLDPDVLDDYGYGALHFAAQHNHVGVVRYLLSKGAKVDGASTACTPLHRAAYAGSLEACAVLIDSGADLERQDSSFGDGRTPLHKATVHEEPTILKLLLKSGASVESRDTQNATPLHAAAEHGTLACVEELVRRGADNDAQDSDGRRPVDYGAAFGHEPVVLALKGNQFLLDEARSRRRETDLLLRDRTVQHEAAPPLPPPPSQEEPSFGYVDAKSQQRTVVVVAPVPARPPRQKTVDIFAPQQEDAQPLEVRSHELPDATAAHAANAVFGALRKSDARRRQGKSERDAVLAAVSINGDALQFAPEAQKCDREVALVAVRNNGLALQHVHPSLRQDKDVVKAAILQNNTALQFASETLQQDRGFILEACYQHGKQLQDIFATMTSDFSASDPSSSKKKGRDE